MHTGNNNNSTASQPPVLLPLVLLTCGTLMLLQLVACCSALVTAAAAALVPDTPPGLLRITHHPRSPSTKDTASDGQRSTRISQDLQREEGDLCRRGFGRSPVLGT